MVRGDYPVHHGCASLARSGCCGEWERVNFDVGGILNNRSDLCSESLSLRGFVVSSFRRLDSVLKNDPCSAAASTTGVLFPRIQTPLWKILHQKLRWEQSLVGVNDGYERVEIRSLIDGDHFDVAVWSP